MLIPADPTLRPADQPGPTATLPTRRPGSVRRTTSVDIVATPGPGQPLTAAPTELTLRGRARDLFTDSRGGTRVLGSALTQLIIGPDRKVRTAIGHPHDLTPLVGRGAAIGFRTAVWRTLRADYDAGSALHQLLDDVPGALIISGFTRPKETPTAPVARRLDVCIGWASESDAVHRLQSEGAPPPPVWNPPAPAWDDDPAGRHTLPDLPPGAMRRFRRLDVWRVGSDARADVGFRDTFADPDGQVRVLHEYTATVSVDGDGTVTGCRATPHVLPHLECPYAAGTASRVIGSPARGLRESVSLDFFGPSTCTHLNDVLRGLADVPALAAMLTGADPSGTGQGTSE